MRAMCPKGPAKRRWGIHRANILPPRGVFAVRSPQIMHGAQILPPSDGVDPCAGMPARAAASRDRLSTAWPLPRGAYPSAPPMPVTCHCLPLAVPVAARGKPRGAADCVTSTGGPTTECCAELGLDSRTVNKWAQNLRRRPQARPGLRQRCRKRPSKGRIPLGGTTGTPPSEADRAAAPTRSFAAIR